MNAFIFPGQSSQKIGMGKDLYDKCPKARAIFEQANDILGERFSDFLFEASEDVLMDTRYTQPAIFIYQVAAALGQDVVSADCTAGHSLGEYAALVVAGALSFEECLPFIKTRGQVFYEAFQKNPSAMGAVIAVPDEQARAVLQQVRAADGKPHTYPAEILENQVKLMTYPVLWTDITMNMKANGVTNFYEVGCDDTLQKIVSRMVPDLSVQSIWGTPAYNGIKPYFNPEWE